MPPTDNQSVVTLPRELRQKFVDLERRLWTLETVVAVCSVLAGLILSYLILFMSDRLWETPVWLRVIITAGGASVWVWFGSRWSRQWILKRRDLRALSNLVQKKYRRLGDRLLGIVELVEEQHHSLDYSPALYRAAIQQVAAEATPLDFREAVDLRPGKLSALALIGLLAVTLVPLALVPAAGWNALLRWAAPTAAITRYTLVGLDGLPAQQIVPHGESFEVTGSVHYRSFWKPQRAIARYGRQPGIEANVLGGQVRFRIPGQVQGESLTIQVGDAKQSVAILPTHRPSLKELGATIQLPDYLRYPSTEEKIRNGILKVIEGSKVAFQGKTTRALATGQVQLDDQNPLPLKLRAEEFSSDALGIDSVSHGAFTWRDNLGLAGSAPWQLAIETQKDAPPVPELPDLPREVAMLETEVLNIKMAASDDFGVREFGLSFEPGSDVRETGTISQDEFKDQATTPRQKKLETLFQFSPALLKIPPDSAVEFHAYATDFFPDRQPAESAAYRIYIVDNARHAELVRQKLESLLVQLEEVTRLEEKIANETRDINELPQEKLAGEAATQGLGELTDEQKQNAANLEQMAREGMKTLREAVRNPEFPEDSLREWAKTMQQMQQLAQEKMQQAAGSLKSAQQNAQPKNSDARSQSLAKAHEQEEDILRGLSELQKNVNKGLDQLQALTLAQRLRKLGSQEKEIETRLQRIVPETIGLLPEEVPAKFKRINEAFAGEQDTVQKESQGLQGEISRFFERTQKKNYEEVNRAMTEARTGEELDKVRGLIEKNIAMEAARNLASWSGRFNEWADKLEPKEKASSGAGGGSGGGAEGEALLKELMALLRLRENESNLRAQTRLLEKKRTTDQASYQEGAPKISGSQQKLLEDLGKIRKENIFGELEQPLGESHGAMRAAASLLSKPQTDKVTDQAQIRTIELLSDAINLINEQAKRGGGQQGSAAEESASLIQMMAMENSPGVGMGKGTSPGGSMAGGTTDQPALPQTGDARGKAADARKVGKASGISGSLPTEFREALENYFNAIEKEPN